MEKPNNIGQILTYRDIIFLENQNINCFDKDMLADLSIDNALLHIKEYQDFIKTDIDNKTLLKMINDRLNCIVNKLKEYV